MFTIFNSVFKCVCTFEVELRETHHRRRGGHQPQTGLKKITELSKGT